MKSVPDLGRPCKFPIGYARLNKASMSAVVDACVGERPRSRCCTAVRPKPQRFADDHGTAGHVGGVVGV